MTAFEIYQLDHNVSTETRLAVTCDYHSSDWLDTVKEAKPLFRHVATIRARDLDHAFQISNLGPEDNINRILPMHSLSIGDIVKCYDTEYVVAMIGFEEI